MPGNTFSMLAHGAAARLVGTPAAHESCSCFHKLGEGGCCSRDACMCFVFLACTVTVDHCHLAETNPGHVSQQIRMCCSPRQQQRLSTYRQPSQGLCKRRFAGHGAMAQFWLTGHGSHGTETAHRPREPWHSFLFEIDPCTWEPCGEQLFQQTSTLALLLRLIRGDNGHSQQ